MAKALSNLSIALSLYVIFDRKSKSKFSEYPRQVMSNSKLLDSVMSVVPMSAIFGAIAFITRLRVQSKVYPSQPKLDF